MGKKTHKLSVSIEENFCLLGIVSDEPDYKLVWLINDRLGKAFGRRDDLVLFHKKMNQEQEFHLFSYEDDNARLTFRLVMNRGENGFFMDELRNIDFLLHIQGDIITEEMEKIVSELSGVKGIRMCLPVDLRKIKEKERLFLW